MALLAVLLFILIFLTGAIALTALTAIFRTLPNGETEKLLETAGNRFFYRKIHRKWFGNTDHEGIFFAISCALSCCRFLFAASAALALILTPLGQAASDSLGAALGLFFLLAVVLFFSFLIADYLPRIGGTSYPESSFRLCAFPASICLVCALPFIYPFLWLTRALPDTLYFDMLHEPDTLAKQEIIELIQGADISEKLDETEKKLLSSLLSFCDHVAREVMVPRVDLFTLEGTTPIREAVKFLDTEGYSRVPIYEENIDNIIGILMYKDLLATYRKYVERGNDPAILEAPISSIVKPPIYTPETKKISDLLQEFRKRQTHMAIVVDEYGGTEGIVTIEDILEDIVGEIIDEYDVEEELFIAQPDGAWIVDPRMSLLDAEEQLGVKIPQEGDYDTIGGYIFHCAGEIPSRGFIISSDAFDLEVLRCNDRTIEKVRIRPAQKNEIPPPEKQGS